MFGFVLVAGVAGAGCAGFGESSSGGGVCVGLQCPGSVDGGAGDGSVFDTSLGEAAPDAEAGPAISDLCGTGCLPDDQNACVGFAPADAGSDAAGAGAGDAADAGAAMAGDAAGGSVDSGMQGPPPPDASGFDDASAGQPPQDGSASDGGLSKPLPRYGCHLTRHGGTPAAVCGTAGTGTEHKPCVDSAGCAPGYGCAQKGTAGECHRFCCQGSAACGSSDFCAERPLKDDSVPGQSLQMAPVCVLADNCNLAEPYPCAAAPPDSCTCHQPGTACMVVGDGLTSCIAPPGTGKAGDSCPCAWGHVCSQATGKCLKICSLTTSDTGCGNGQCQASKQMPRHFGVCVLSTPSDGGY